MKNFRVGNIVRRIKDFSNSVGEYVKGDVGIVTRSEEDTLGGGISVDYLKGIKQDSALPAAFELVMESYNPTFEEGTEVICTNLDNFWDEENPNYILKDVSISLGSVHTVKYPPSSVNVSVGKIGYFQKKENFICPGCGFVSIDCGEDLIGKIVYRGSSCEYKIERYQDSDSTIQLTWHNGTSTTYVKLETARKNLNSGTWTYKEETISPVNLPELITLEGLKEGDIVECTHSWDNTIINGEKYSLVRRNSSTLLVESKGMYFRGNGNGIGFKVHKLCRKPDEMAIKADANKYDKDGTELLFKTIRSDGGYYFTIGKVVSGKSIHGTWKDFTNGTTNYTLKRVYELIQSKKWKVLPDKLMTSKEELEQIFKPENIETASPGPVWKHIKEYKSINLTKSDNNMSSNTNVTIEVSNAPFAVTEVKTVFGNVLNNMSESTLRARLLDISSAKAALKDLGLGKVVKDSYQDRELKALDAARVAIIDRLDSLEV